QSDIEQDNQTVEEFVNTLLDNLRKLVITVNVSEIKGEAKPNGGQVERLTTPCPNCGKDIVVRPKLFACTGCDFKIWGTVAEKKLTAKQVETLIQKGKTGIIKGFKSKAGKTFDAMLILQDKPTGKVGFEFNRTVPCRKRF
ncbi:MULTISPECIES: topoisomerase C-terminal repeat-containing protein, partial [Arsenophonus]|uniref:topoisomerase C-terminal repeat-containing protein n=1 Tax=Arsenophonus TaxID=637 RepID=UPI00387A4AB6